VIRVTNSGKHKALADIDFIDPVKGNLVARIEGYECIIDASLNCAFRCNQLPQESRTDAIDNR
jgi:hypothetical protein